MITEPFNRKKVKHYDIPGHARELTFSCYHQHPYLSDTAACEILLSELKNFKDEHSFQIWAYVLMPTHVHILTGPLDPTVTVSEMLNDIKGRMAKQYRDYLQSSDTGRYKSFLMFDKSKKRDVFRFWQPGGGFDRNLWESKAIRASIIYIEANPVKKKLAASPEEYRWSSAYARKRNVGLVPDRFNMGSFPGPAVSRII